MSAENDIGAGEPWSPSTIASAYSSGLSIRHLIKKFKTTHGTILKCLMQEGVEPRSRAESCALRDQIAPDMASQVVHGYLAGMSEERLAKVFHFDFYRIRALLIEAGVALRTRAEAVRLARADGLVLAGDRLAVAESQYGKGQTLAQIGAHLGVCASSVMNAFEKHGIDRRQNGDFRVHPIDAAFFDCIDTEEKAWAWGFAATDGNIDNNVVQWMLSEQDRDALETLQRCFKTTTPIRSVLQKNGRSYCQLALSCKRLAEGARRSGLAPRKTWTVAPLQLSDPALASAMWRGCVDGDGCIEWSKGSPIISFCGNFQMVNGFLDFVRTLTSTKATVRPHKSIWSVRFVGSYLAPIVAKALYANASISLNRKRLLAESVIGCIPRSTIRHTFAT